MELRWLLGGLNEQTRPGLLHNHLTYCCSVLRAAFMQGGKRIIPLVLEFAIG